MRAVHALCFAFSLSAVAVVSCAKTGPSTNESNVNTAGAPPAKAAATAGHEGAHESEQDDEAGRAADAGRAPPTSSDLLHVNGFEFLGYTDLARSAAENRQNVAVNFLLRGKGSRSAFGLGAQGSHCLGAECQYGRRWYGGIQGFASYDLTTKGTALYIAPSLYYSAKSERRFAIAPQMGLSAHVHPLTSPDGESGGRFGFGGRIYLEPRFGIGHSTPVDVMFGLGLFVSLGGRPDKVSVRAQKDKDPPSPTAALQRLIDRELDDIAIGDPDVADCQLMVGSAADAPFDVPAGGRCGEQLSSEVAPQTCALVVAYAALSLNARWVDRETGKLLVQDASASEWPVVTWCNTNSEAQRVTYQLWAPNSDKSQEAFAARFNFAIPWGPMGAAGEIPAAGASVHLDGDGCVLTHVAHGGDVLALAVDDPSRSFTVTAPWYMELKLLGLSATPPTSEFLWSRRQPFAFVVDAPDASAPTTRGVQPTTGGPVMFCPVMPSVAASQLDASTPDAQVGDAGLLDARADTGEPDAERTSRSHTQAAR